MRAAHAPSSGHGSHSWWEHVLEHLREDSPAILFVPALVFVLHHFDWLYGLDAYAFLAIGNLSAVPDAYERTHRPAGPAGAVVVLIDATTHEERYHEISPLNRCALKEDLEALYALDPLLVAIDLDISPAVWLRVHPTELLKSSVPETAVSEHKVQWDCEVAIYDLIREQAKRVGTVLMLPTPGATDAMRGIQKNWKKTMCVEHVMFGRADVPLEYGIVINQHKGSGSFADAVYLLGEKLSKERMQNSQIDGSTRNSKSESVAAAPAGQSPAWACEVTDDLPKERLQLINPRAYVDDVHAVPLQITEQPSKSGLQPVALATDRSTEFKTRLDAALRPLERKIIFFGAAYGMDDVFMTPVGELYGVEVQSAAYLSQRAPITDISRVVAFALDVLMALGFSVLIAIFWGAYFRHRMGAHAFQRQTACVYVFFLTCFFIAAVFITLLVSFFALRAGLWLSPIPIAIGMLIDAFALGSVHQAIEVATRQKLETVARLQTAHEARSFETAAARELRQHRPESRSILESLYRFVVLDVARLFSRGQPAAASALLAKRAIWIVCVVYAVKLMISH